jgi:hypothetical protein
MIAAVDSLPGEAQTKPTAILALGELTGHSHRIENAKTAEILELRGQMFLRVTADSARVIHQEHKPITLPRGTYRFWFQREYTPQAIRRIVD